MNCKPFRIRAEWFCIVDNKLFGPWELKVYAQAGYETELRRAIKRRQKEKDEKKDNQGDEEPFDLT